MNDDLTLQDTSIATNAGSNALVPSGVITDLAGNPRIQGDAVDMGAYESAVTSQSVSAVSLVVTNLNDSGAGSLRAAITSANAAASDDTIAFRVDGTIMLASAMPDLANNGTLTITGNGAANTLISGNNSVRVFTVASGANVTRNTLTLTNGSATDGDDDRHIHAFCVVANEDDVTFFMRAFNRTAGVVQHLAGGVMIACDTFGELYYQDVMQHMNVHTAPPDN